LQKCIFNIRIIYLNFPQIIYKTAVEGNQLCHPIQGFEGSDIIFKPTRLNYSYTTSRYITTKPEYLIHYFHLLKIP